MNDDVPIVDPPSFEPNVRLAISIEPEALQLLDALATRLYPSKRRGTGRARTIEIAVRALYKQVIAGDAG